MIFNDFTCPPSPPKNRPPEKLFKWTSFDAEIAHPPEVYQSCHRWNPTLIDFLLPAKTAGVVVGPFVARSLSKLAIMATRQRCLFHPTLIDFLLPAKNAGVVVGPFVPRSLSKLAIMATRQRCLFLVGPFSAQKSIAVGHDGHLMPHHGPQKSIAVGHHGHLKLEIENEIQIENWNCNWKVKILTFKFEF